MWYREIQLEKFHAGEAIEVSLSSIYRWDVRRTDDLTINKGGGRRRQRCKAAAVDGGVDTWPVTSTGRMVRPALASVTARSDRGGGNILTATMKGGKAVALMGARVGKGG